MRHSYFLALLFLVLAGQRAHAQQTAWRPFRPGFVYSYSPLSSTSSTIPVHTLRVDSTYATAAGDSVYAFNRLLRPLSSSAYYYGKSRNNLLGARLRWHPGSSEYYLEANAEPALGGPATPTVLLLRPRAAVGSTWAASTQPALTATLSRRIPDPAGTSADSLANIVLSNGQQVVLSRRYGLRQGPQWLTLDGSSNAWQQSTAPQAGLGDYDARTLFALSAGDELGYESTIYSFSSTFTCSQGYRLRRITGRQLTADSLVITYREQGQTTTTSFPGCGTPGTVVGPVQAGRWAISLRTGQSPQFPYLPLLAGEYTTLANKTMFMGQSTALKGTLPSCLASARTLSFVPVYMNGSQTGQYNTGIDDAAYVYAFSASLGLGLITLGSSPNYSNYLAYYKRNGVTCGQSGNYASLLPTRAARAAEVAALAPNPATEAAMLTLAAPTQPGTVLALTNMLGRTLWRTPIAVGQLRLAVPLGGQPAGLYLVQLLVPAASPYTWKLVKE